MALRSVQIWTLSWIFKDKARVWPKSPLQRPDGRYKGTALHR